MKHTQIMFQIITPIIVAIVVGIGSSIIAMKISYGVAETRMNMIEDKLNELNRMFVIIEQNQIELAGRGQWMVIIEDRVTANRERSMFNAQELKDIEDIVREMFNRTDAERMESRLKLIILTEIANQREETPNE